METRIEVKVEGTTPLIMHAFAEADWADATSGTRSSSVGDRGTEREQAEKCLHLDTDKKTIVIPQPMIFACIVNAGKFFKEGKCKVTTQKTSLIPAGLSIEGVCFPLKYREPWSVDRRPVCIPSTGGRILRCRPIFDEWSFSFTILLDTTMFTAKRVREFVDAAGTRSGLGDFRPACKGPYGKFKVVSWVKK